LQKSIGNGLSRHLLSLTVAGAAMTRSTLTPGVRNRPPPPQGKRRRSLFSRPSSPGYARRIVHADVTRTNSQPIPRWRLTNTGLSACGPMTHGTDPGNEMGLKLRPVSVNPLLVRPRGNGPAAPQERVHSRHANRPRPPSLQRLRRCGNLVHQWVRFAKMRRKALSRSVIMLCLVYAYGKSHMATISLDAV
jgi:hypothetical protein